MPIPDSVILTAGFALAHAAWSVSDLPAGELLTPLAIVERDNQRELLRFEADTQEEAIAKGKRTLENLKASVTAWAFVREGLFPIEGRKTDVLVIDGWSKGMSAPVAFIQPFQPFSSGEFKVLGQALAAIDGRLQEPEETQRLDTILYRGVSQHPKAGSLWSGWHQK